MNRRLVSFMSIAIAGAASMATSPIDYPSAHGESEPRIVELDTMDPEVRYAVEASIELRDLRSDDIRSGSITLEAELADQAGEAQLAAELNTQTLGDGVTQGVFGVLKDPESNRGVLELNGPTTLECDGARCIMRTEIALQQWGAGSLEAYVTIRSGFTWDTGVDGAEPTNDDVRVILREL